MQKLYVEYDFFCLFRGNYFRQLFDHLLEHGGAAIIAQKGVDYLQMLYHQRNKDFPVVSIPGRQ